MSLECSWVNNVTCLSSSDEGIPLSGSYHTSMIDDSSVIVLLIEESFDDNDLNDPLEDSRRSHKTAMDKATCNQSMNERKITTRQSIDPDSQSLLGLQFINSYDNESDTNSFSNYGHISGKTHPPREIRLISYHCNYNHPRSIGKIHEEYDSRALGRVPKEVRIIRR